MKLLGDRARGARTGRRQAHGAWARKSGSIADPHSGPSIPGSGLMTSRGARGRYASSATSLADIPRSTTGTSGHLRRLPRGLRSFNVNERLPCSRLRRPGREPARPASCRSDGGRVGRSAARIIRMISQLSALGEFRRRPHLLRHGNTDGCDSSMATGETGGLRTSVLDKRNILPEGNLLHSITLGDLPESPMGSSGIVRCSASATRACNAGADLSRRRGPYLNHRSLI